MLEFVMLSIIFWKTYLLGLVLKLYIQIVGIPMGTNCAPLVAYLFLFCFERSFMLSFSEINQANVIEKFNSTSSYLDDLLNIDNPYFEQMISQKYPAELQLDKTKTSEAEAPFWTWTFPFPMT